MEHQFFPFVFGFVCFYLFIFYFIFIFFIFIIFCTMECYGHCLTDCHTFWEYHKICANLQNEKSQSDPKLLYVLYALVMHSLLFVVAVPVGYAVLTLFAVYRLSNSSDSLAKEFFKDLCILIEFYWRENIFLCILWKVTGNWFGFHQRRSSISFLFKYLTRQKRMN